MCMYKNVIFLDDNREIKAYYVLNKHTDGKVINKKDDEV